MLPPLPPPAAGDVAKDAAVDVNVLPFDVKTVVEVLLASVEAGPDVAVAEPDTPEELSPALVPAEAELGKWPMKNCMLCPVLFGSEHILVSVLESLNATVADAAMVQLQ